MANWSDPRATAAPYAGTASDARDAGLRSYMLSVYNYMASGVLLTGVVALLFAKSGYVNALFSETGQMGPLGWIVMLAPLGVVMAMSFGQNRMATSTPTTLITKASASDWKNRLSRLAMMMPTTPMIRKVPKPDRSFLVV